MPAEHQRNAFAISGAARRVSTILRPLFEASPLSKNGAVPTETFMTAHNDPRQTRTPIDPPLAGAVSGVHLHPAHPSRNGPLVVAIHGGTYTSAYFDVPGYSLLDRADAIGIRVVALNRPGYAESPPLQGAQATIRNQARFLIPALKDCWQRLGQDCAGIVLIGHSIGAAIAASIAAQVAAEAIELPLIGLAISGVGLRTPPDHRPRWEALPDIPSVELPLELKEAVMFSPPGAFDPEAVLSSRIANAPAPRAELVDIVSTWHDTVHATLGAITVPVHYRQAEVDLLWIVSPEEIEGFGKALVSSSRVDCAMVRGTGHCMDFHHVGHALQVQQLGFALQCASEAAATKG
jgi:pimeloyl-ACP methyl ester carboxylesterase